MKPYIIPAFLIISSCAKSAQISAVENVNKPTATLAAEKTSGGNSSDKNSTSSDTSSKTSTSNGSVAKIDLSVPSTYDMGAIIPGVTLEKTITFINSGEMIAKDISVTGLSSPFGFKGGTYPGTGGTCSTTLPASATCTIIITFSSSTLANFSKSVTLNYNDSSNAVTTTLALSATASKFTQVQKLAGSGSNSRIANDYYGSGLAIYENTIAIGASNQDYDQNGANSVSDAGAVYVYTSVNNVWTLQQRIVGSGTNGRVASDFFGISVGLYKDTLVVGANGQDTDANGANSVSGSGAVFVYKRANGVWTLQQKLVASGTNARNASDVFGASVYIYDTTIIVGAPNNGYDENGANLVSNAGAAFIFTESNGTWSLQQKITGQGTNGRVSGDYFGRNVTLYKETAAVTSYTQSYDQNGATNLGAAGAVWVYTRSGSTWSLQQKLVGTGTNGRLASDYFGIGLGLYEDTIACGAMFQSYDENGANNVSGAGAVYVFTRTAGLWSLQQKIVGSGPGGRNASDWFGVSLSLFQDTLSVSSFFNATDENGANSVANAGAVFIYSRSGSTWSFLQKIVPTGTNARGASNYFGSNGQSCYVATGNCRGNIIYNNILATVSTGNAFDETGANSVSNAGAAYIFQTQ